MTISTEDIPEVLRELDQWICWREEERDGDPTKVPVKPFDPGQDHYYASSTDETTWRTAEAALKFHQEGSLQTDGIGFVFTEDDVVAGVDLDDVRDPDSGDVEPWAEDVIDTLDSFSEVSPSGTGFHVYVMGFHPGSKNKVILDSEYSTLDRFDETEIEMYDQSRFFTFTGEHVESTPKDVKQRADKLRIVYDEYMAGEEGGEDAEATAPVERPEIDLNDEEIIEKAKAAENGNKFEELYRGSDSLHGNDTSRADLAFCGMLAFWTGGDRSQMDRIFRHSNRMREKWDEKRGQLTYGELTLEKALEGKSEFYDPSKHGKSKPNYDIVQQATTDGGVATQQPSEADIDQPALEDRVQDILVAYEADDEMPQRTVIHRVALEIGWEYSFVHPPEQTRGWRTTLYVYIPEEGIYEPVGERFARELAEKLLGDFLNNQQANEIVGKIKRMSGVEKEDLKTKPYRLVVGNGILDLRTGDLDEWTPDEYHRTKIGVNYEPDAECPRLDQFFHEIVEGKDVPTLYQLVAHSLYREYVAEKAAMLVGDGRNGKSVFLDVMEKFLGSENVTHRSMQDLDGQRFAANNLQGKLANVHPDMGDEMIRDLGTFKKLTGRDTMIADVKYEKPVVFENYATLLFAANRMPAMGEDTHALWRRWIYINFPNTFEPDGPNHIPKRQLMEELTNQEEFEGLLARCVSEINEWWNGRDWFTNIMSPDQVREKMKRASEPVYDFASVCLEVDEESSILKEHVRTCYRRYAREEGLPAQSDNVFGESLLNIRDFPIESAQERKDGVRTTVYKNIRLSPRGRQVLGLDEPQDDAQRSMEDRGPKERSEILLEAIRELETADEPVQKAMAIGRASAHGLDLTKGESAWQDLRDRGEIQEDPSGEGWQST